MLPRFLCLLPKPFAAVLSGFCFKESSFGFVETSASDACAIKDGSPLHHTSSSPNSEP